MEKKTEAHISLGFAEALTILFIALKLTGYISWSWLWVLSPIWISLALIGFLGLLIFILTRIQKRYGR